MGPKVHVHLYDEDLVEKDGETPVQQDLFDGTATDEYDDYFQYSFVIGGQTIEIRVMKETE